MMSRGNLNGRMPFFEPCKKKIARTRKEMAIITILQIQFRGSPDEKPKSTTCSPFCFFSNNGRGSCTRLQLCILPVLFWTR